MAFVLKILCFEKMEQTRTLTLMKLTVSIHQAGVNESNSDSDEEIAIRTGGVGECGQSTIDSPQEITVRTRINTNLDVADASQLDFFYRLFTPEMFNTIAVQTNWHAHVKFSAIPSLPCRK